MSFKYLMTACLLFSSAYLVAQPGNIEHSYYDVGHDNYYAANITQNFNDRFNNKQKRSWLQLAELAYISKSQAIKIAKRRTAGKILSANLIQKEHNAFYKIKVLTDQGRIKTVRINAKRR